MYRTLIDVATLGGMLQGDNCCLLDCRFSLADPGQGRAAWAAGHIPGAVYAHLDDDLSGEIRPGVTGRHPLPPRDELARRLGQWGIDADTQVVAYDDAGGAIAARCWWLLRWLGHDAVAVLDGGWPAWLAAGGAQSCEPPRRAPAQFVPRQPLLAAVDADEVARASAAGDRLLLDARDPARFRGEVEPLDPVAGHIPGARCAPFAGNLADGAFRPVDELRARHTALLGGAAIEDVICYCGSGVTAAHNVLAMQHAGLGAPALYPGSWSEWVADPARPVAQGDSEG